MILAIIMSITLVKVFQEYVISSVNFDISFKAKYNYSIRFDRTYNDEDIAIAC